MKEILKNKKVIISIVLVVIILISGIFLFSKENKVNNKDNDSKENIYTMYVKINPLVKLTFEGIKIVDYELMNDDARDIYKDIDLKGKSVYDAVAVLCAVARDNNIAFKSLDIITDYNFDYEELESEIKNNSKYNFDYEIILDIKELLNEEEILDNESNSDVKKYNVTFDSDGGSKVSKQVIKENGVVSKPKDPTKKGYSFIEWQLDGDKFDFNSSVKEDITLKAKWEKEDTRTTTKNNTSTGTTTKKQTNTNSNKTTTSTTNGTTSKLKSTPDNINLNDNIMAYDTDGGDEINTSYFIFTDNATDVLKDFCRSSNTVIECIPPHPDDDPELFSKWQEKYSQLTYNSDKAKKAKNEIISYLSGKNGVINAEVNNNPKEFRYYYDELFFERSNNIGLEDFVNAYTERNLNINKDVNKIIHKNGGIYIYGAQGGDGAILKLLDEKLCAKYNLTCSRW